MHRRQVLFSLILVVILTVLVSGIASGKGHVPDDQVQVCHKGRVAHAVDAPALAAHVRHGDIQLSACDASTPSATFTEGADCSGVVDLDGDDKDDAAVTRTTTGACMANTNF